MYLYDLYYKHADIYVTVIHVYKSMEYYMYGEIKCLLSIVEIHCMNLI